MIGAQGIMYLIIIRITSANFKKVFHVQHFFSHWFWSVQIPRTCHISAVLQCGPLGLVQQLQISDPCCVLISLINGKLNGANYIYLLLIKKNYLLQMMIWQLKKIIKSLATSICRKCCPQPIIHARFGCSCCSFGLVQDRNVFSLQLNCVSILLGRERKRPPCADYIVLFRTQV